MANTKIDNALENAPSHILMEYVAHEDALALATDNDQDDELLQDEHWGEEHKILLHEVTDEEMENLKLILNVKI